MAKFFGIKYETVILFTYCLLRISLAPNYERPYTKEWDYSWENIGLPNIVAEGLMSKEVFKLTVFVFLADTG